MSTSPCLRIGTDTVSAPSRRRTRIGRSREHAVSQNPLGLLEASLEVADGVQLRELDAERDERLRDFRAEAGHDHVGAHEPRRSDRLQQVIRNLRVDRRHPRDVHDDDLGPVRAYRAKQALGDEPCALGVDDADDREQQQTLADLEYRRRELPDGLLLLPDDALALEHEDVDNEADVEERDLLERHEVLEPVEGFALELFHDRAADVLEQLVERAEEDARRQTGLGVEGAELDALLDVLHPVLAWVHRHQALPLELARPLHHGPPRAQGAGGIEARW